MHVDKHTTLNHRTHLAGTAVCPPRGLARLPHVAVKRPTQNLDQKLRALEHLLGYNPEGARRIACRSPTLLLLKPENVRLKVDALAKVRCRNAARCGDARQPCCIAGAGKRTAAEVGASVQFAAGPPPLA